MCAPIITSQINTSSNSRTYSTPHQPKTQQEIEARCKERLRTWGLRIAVANLQAARRRPRLTRDEALLLMDGLAAVAMGVKTTSRTEEETGLTRVVEEGVIKEEEVAGELLAAVLAMEAVEGAEEGKCEGKEAGIVDVEDAVDALSFDLHRTVREVSWLILWSILVGRVGRQRDLCQV